MNQAFEVVAVSGTDAHLANVAQREQVRVAEVTMERPISPIKDIISLWQLYRLFKKEKPRIVHSITPKAGLLTMMAGKMAGVPVRIHTFTGLIFPSKRGFLQKILITMDRLLCFCASNIYPEGQGVKNDLIHYKITSKPLKVLANGNVNGIDTQYFSRKQISTTDQERLKTELGIDEGAFVFIFVGRLAGDKGINELVTAFERLSAESENVKLLLVGPLESELDPLKPTTLDAIKQNPKIKSVGFQKEVRSYFAISDALVFPSYREGFPNVVMQSGAMELPSIVTDINGCNEIIAEGQNGMIIPAKDDKALEVAMIKMMKDTALYQQLKLNARAMITSRYKQKVVWEALLEEYRRLEQNV
ncbi:Capsular polysaccharide biosynthesis glycosyl transferase [Flavobacterium limnosediminis JC2902]|uniref:Capsular polysaccharide biosynthesis glycosyl transferase n=1 Tax=Flavobacterium limnosediminis JC2902 TaxID=1341181 RepID=V6SKZ9_9FLAO|nr:Capsular polysaccharide biosynthesis glycosyl transferase [Flavobacterium limnosediminis JC2902]